MSTDAQYPFRGRVRDKTATAQNGEEDFFEDEEEEGSFSSSDFFSMEIEDEETLGTGNDDSHGGHDAARSGIASAAASHLLGSATTVRKSVSEVSPRLVTELEDFQKQILERAERMRCYSGFMLENKHFLSRWPDTLLSEPCRGHQKREKHNLRT